MHKGANSENTYRRPFFSEAFSLNSLLSSVKFAVIAIITLVIYSFIVASGINEFIMKVINSDTVYSDILGSNFKLVSMTDIMVISHMVGLEFKLSTNTQTLGLITKGLAISILIPVKCLLFAGNLINKDHPERQAFERFLHTIPVAIFYAILLACFIPFVGLFESELSPTVVKSDFSMISLILYSFFISLVFLSIGSMKRMKKILRQKGGNKHYGLSVQKAILHSVVGILLCSTAIVIWASHNGQATGNSASIAFAAPQMSNLAHMGSIEASIQDHKGKGKITFSIIEGANASGDSYEVKEFISSESAITNGNLSFLFLIPLILHIWAGISLLGAESGSIRKEIAVYAIIFGLTNALLFQLMSIKLADTSSDIPFSIHLETAFLPTLAFSILISFIVTYLTAIIFGRMTAVRRIVLQHK
ncbi:hypothetical protein LC085_10910 [Bacillus tianshenii]|uniref:hypothetical protein n=1 Tax=Sutcliffiella tianshenii TaxID=1463404 RepID=UPI001CD24BD6|nr:hypothetical protein [Bacillus tianshenii]MCA1320419.1 hypothetical protein [Bacillus tianshenii]